MRRRELIVILAAIAGLSACKSSPNVSTDVTPGANFSAYRSFAFVNTAPPAGLDPVLYERIQQDVGSALRGKGYTSGAPGDLSVIVTLGAKDRTDINTWGTFGRQVDVYQYTEGKLAVDVFDTKTRRPVWHGQATETIQPDKPDPAAINTAVASVMSSFPVR
jgi:hypothetical protein